MKVIVVGAGIVGASAAYHLAKKHVDVTMVDKPQEGKATAAGAGIVSPWTSNVENDAWYEIAKRSAKYYPELIAELKRDGEYETGYKQVGALLVSKEAEKLDIVEAKLGEKQKEAPEMGEVMRLKGEKARGLFPLLNEELEAVFVSGAARVDGRLLRDALKRAAVKHGAAIIEDEAALIYESEKIVGVTVHGDAILADKVLIATGAWAPELLAPLGMKLHVEPQRGQIAHMTLPGMDTADWPVILPQSSHYMLAFDDSRIVAGATRETGSGFDYRLTAGGVHEVTTEALAVAPGLKAGTLEEVRIGFRPMGPDQLPIIGQVASLEKIVLATGLGASGLTVGPYAGLLAAALIRDEQIDFDLTPYDPARAMSK